MHIKHILTLIPLLLIAPLMVACTEQDPYSLPDPRCGFGPALSAAIPQPANTSYLVVELRIKDENCVEQIDRTTAEATLTGQLSPDPNDPNQVLRNATIVTSDGVANESPYDWDPLLPAIYSTFIDSTVVFFSIDAIAIVPSGYTLMCRITQDGRTIHEQKEFNGFPHGSVDKIVLCLWPSPA